jgi:hypothetical protein
MLHPPYGETSSDDIVRYSSAEKRVDGTNQKVNDSEQNTRGAEDSGENTTGNNAATRSTDGGVS